MDKSINKADERIIQHNVELILQGEQDAAIIKDQMTKIRRLENEALIDSETIGRCQVEIDRLRELMG